MSTQSLEPGVARRPRGLALLSLMVAGALLMPIVATAADDDDDEEKPWQEGETQLPPYPDKADLIPFKVGSVSDTQFYVDGKTLSVGNDQVVRYSLVIISSSGAESVTFEGMRCKTKERRIYAAGRADKTWSKSPSSRWVLLQGNTNNPRIELYVSYFCLDGASTWLTTEKVLRSLRSGGRDWTNIQGR